MSTPQPIGLAPVIPIDRLGRRRSKATMPGYNAGRAPGNKGIKYEPEPLTVEEVALLLETLATPTPRDRYIDVLARARLRALIVVLWRTGLRIAEALDLRESDLTRDERVVTVRCGKGGKRRLVQMDDWAWRELDAWMNLRTQLRPGAVFCIVSGRTEGQRWAATDVRRQLRDLGPRAGVRKRCNPHAFRHTLAADLWREGLDVLAIQRQLGHARLDVTQTYLRGIATDEVLKPIGERKPPMVPISGA